MYTGNGNDSRTFARMAGLGLTCKAVSIQTIRRHAPAIGKARGSAGFRLLILLIAIDAACAASYTVSFTSQSSVTVLGSVHQLGTPNLDVACYDTTVTPWQSVKPGGWTIDPATFDVVITFSQPQTGRCTLLAAQIDAEANQVRGSAGALSCTFANLPPSNVVTRACADHHGSYGLPWSHPMDFGQDKAGRETDNGNDVVFDLHFVGGVMSWDMTVQPNGGPVLRGKGVFSAPAPTVQLATWVGAQDANGKCQPFLPPPQLGTPPSWSPCFYQANFTPDIRPNPGPIAAGIGVCGSGPCK